MRVKVTILTLIGQILFFFVQTIYATTNPGKLKVLSLFVEKEILYNESTPLDSVIAWSEDVLSDMSPTEHKDLYFLLQLQLAEAYTLRGDISLASDRAQQMYEEAQASNNRFGIAIANQAIGNAYNTIAQLCSKALESYQDALYELSQASDIPVYKMRLLLKISHTLQCQGRIEEAREVLKELETMLSQTSNYPIEFFFNLVKADCAISHGLSEQSHLKEAAAYLHKADSIYRLYPEKFYRFHLDCVTADYYRLMGNKDRTYWDKAQNIYSHLQDEYKHNKRSIYYRQTALGKINLYYAQGKNAEACRIYQELYPLIDTLASQSYIRQINVIKAKYKVDKVKIASEKMYNKAIISIVGGFVILAALFSLLAIQLHKQRKKVKLSTRKLDLSLINAENAIRTKSMFLSNMSHEIRTPLNALSGFSGLLTEESLDAETRLQCNEIIQQNSELLLKLIGDVIDLSSLEFGKLQFSIAKHDVVSICNNVIDTVNKVKQTQADVLFITKLESMEIETDKSRLQQILINLLINATKFTRQGSITLELKKETDEMLLFSVADTGCGIPKEKQRNIFRRFEKVNETDQGSGLGLSISQLIIEHMGGSIWIDTDYTEGAKFCFTHPINQSETNGKEAGK